MGIIIESLENRRLHRGGVVGFEGRTLTISGTAGDDVIAVRGNRTAVTVTLNGRTQTVTAKEIRRVIVWAGAGADVVDAGNAVPIGGQPLKVACRIDGGAGDDALYSGQAGDTLLGSSGDDRLFGYGPRDPYDYHDGGPGNDRMVDGGVMNGGRGLDAVDPGPFSATLPIVSGIERQYSSFYTYPVTDRYGRIPVSMYRGNLTTRDGRLVYREPTLARYEIALSGPTVRADGMLQIVLTTRARGDGYVPPMAEVTTTIDASEATRRGIVLKYDDDTDASAPGEQVVLLASTNA